MRINTSRALSFCVLGLALGAAPTNSSAQTVDESTLEAWGPGYGETTPVCAGIRGNGPRLWAHFTSLARIVEEFGPISAAAGGDRFCPPIERRARIALLFKSLQVRGRPSTSGHGAVGPQPAKPSP